MIVLFYICYHVFLLLLLNCMLIQTLNSFRRCVISSPTKHQWERRKTENNISGTERVKHLDTFRLLQFGGKTCWHHKNNLFFIHVCSMAQPFFFCCCCLCFPLSQTVSHAFCYVVYSPRLDREPCICQNLGPSEREIRNQRETSTWVRWCYRCIHQQVHKKRAASFYAGVMYL